MLRDLEGFGTLTTKAVPAGSTGVPRRLVGLRGASLGIEEDILRVTRRAPEKRFRDCPGSWYRSPPDGTNSTLQASGQLLLPL